MRIALLVDPLTLGSRGGRHAPGLARALIERGHEVRGFGAPPGVVPHSVEFKELGGLSRYGADALIAYDALSPTALSAARVAKKSGACLILVEPGLTSEATPLHERVLQGIGERLWGRYVRGAATRLVALDPVAEELALSEGFEPERVSILPTGVDLERWNPVRRGTARTRHGLRGRVVLYAGPLETSIGIEGLIRSFARSVGQNPDWSLALFGRGSGRRALRTVAERLGVASSVHWLDGFPKEDAPELFRAATLFAAPAFDDRPAARWVLRAMACGLPVLAANVARFRWAVEDGERGLLVDPSDGAAWEAALQHAANAPVARERWGRACRSWAEATLDWARIAESFEELCCKPREEEAGAA